MKIIYTLIMGFALYCQTGNAQTFTANIKDLAFMRGKWFVKHQWGDMEEYWGEPIGNNMISSYRCVQNGKVVFYEFVVIEQTDSVPVMILRHFKPASIGWEDKEHPNHYPLICISTNKATFKSSDGVVTLTYQLIADDKLDVVLEEENKEGKLETTAFHYNRERE